MEIYLAALLWGFVSAQVAIVVGTVVRFGSSGMPPPRLPLPNAAASLEDSARGEPLTEIL
jgi:hypothetical protein